MGDTFSIVRDLMTRRSVLESYFSLLGETLDRHGLKDNPALIYNCDES